jgi:hypothetical protein
MFADCLSKLFFILLLTITCVPLVCAQEQQPTPQPTPLTAPPPLRTIPQSEKQKLESLTDAKQRLKQTIEFAIQHLSAAEKHTSDGNYDAASYEVGSYHALVQNALTFLATMKRDSNKTRDLYKRFELALRADGPRLTAMRRVTPLEFAVWIKQVEEFARESRTEALNSFYGHTVVRDPEKQNQKPKETPTPKSN